MAEQISVVHEVEQAAVGIVRPVGSESAALITRLSVKNDCDNYVGNILRRTCMLLGESACQSACALRGSENYGKNEDKACSDRNLVEGLEAVGIDPSDVLMVAVTGNEVGFGDMLQTYADKGKLKSNPEGWRELPGFNAFFARPEEVPAIGSRLADCAHLEFEFNDRDGNKVIGFEHGTRPNMYGPDAYAFELNGQPVSYTQFVIGSAIEHYGADPASIQIRISSSIKPDNFVKHFADVAQMEKHIPGWYSAGYVKNISKPDWKPGDAIDYEHVWHADARGLILHDTKEAMEALGVPAANLVADEMLDPADTAGEYSSYENRSVFGDTRDLYLVAHASAFKEE